MFFYGILVGGVPNYAKSSKIMKIMNILPSEVPERIPTTPSPNKKRRKWKNKHLDIPTKGTLARFIKNRAL